MKKLEDIVKNAIEEELQENIFTLGQEARKFVVKKTPVYTGSLKRSWDDVEFDPMKIAAVEFETSPISPYKKPNDLNILDYATRVLGEGSTNLPDGIFPPMVEFLNKLHLPFEYEFEDN